MTPQDILGQMTGALQKQLGAGYGQIAGFVTTQGALLAKEAADIAQSRIAGACAGDDDFWQWSLQRLENDTANMARAVAVMSLLTLEEAWNAMVGALWGGLHQILAAAGLALPTLPSAPPG